MILRDTDLGQQFLLATPEKKARAQSSKGRGRSGGGGGGGDRQ